MAEKSISAEALAIELTYRNNADGTAPDGARAFRYKDYQRFMYRLRKAYKAHYGTTGEIRYLVAGERGSQKGRVHWHVILFADRPITKLGEWTDFHFNQWKTPGPRLNVMNHWNMWPHGHVMPKTPNYGGMAYVVKYVLKDQFNVVKSEGKKRFTKAELDGAGMFRMSKKPPLGFRFLQRRLDDYEAAGAVPVSLKMTVSGLKGFWYPTGKLREYMLARLHLINRKVRMETGRDARQWNTLLATVVSQEKDWEGLIYGEVQEKVQLLDAYGYTDGTSVVGTTYSELLRNERAEFSRFQRFTKGCGNPWGCKRCEERNKQSGQQGQLASWAAQRFRDYVRDRGTLATDDGFPIYLGQRGLRNPHCAKETEGLQKAPR